jgi:hypothetical protein
MAAGLVAAVVWSMFASAALGPVKVLVFFLPALATIDVPFTSSLRLVIRGGGQLASFGFAGFECYWSQWSFTFSFVFGLIGPLLLALLCAVIFVCGFALLRWRAVHSREPTAYSIHGIGESSADPVKTAAPQLSWGMRCLRSALFLLNLQFFAFVTAMLAPLTCSDFDVPRLINAPYVLCSQWMRWVGVFSFVAYGIGGPLLLFWAVHRRPHSLWSAPFRVAFRPSAQYWELILILRRILFLIASLTIPPNNAFRVTCQAIVLVASAIAELWATPFASAEDNLNDLTSLGVLLLNLTASVNRRAMSADDDSAVKAASSTVFVLNSLFVVFSVGRVVWGAGAVRRVRASVRKNFSKWRQPKTRTAELSRPLL